jgi:hypothetical protein
VATVHVWVGSVEMMYAAAVIHFMCAASRLCTWRRKSCDVSSACTPATAAIGGGSAVPASAFLLHCCAAAIAQHVCTRQLVPQKINNQAGS